MFILSRRPTGNIHPACSKSNSPPVSVLEKSERFSTLPLLYVAGFDSLFLEVLLVVFLGAIKFRSRDNFGHDGFLENSFFNQNVL
jgi:hypothetical protein